MAIPFEQIVEEDLSLGTEQIAVTSPAGGSMTGRKISMATWHPFSVHFFGAAGDGVNDDTQAVQRAINSAQRNGGGVVYFPNGTYRLSGEIYVTANGVQFLGETRDRAILQWDDTADRGLVVDTAVSDPVQTALAADCAIGDRSITVQSGAALTPGAWAFLDDNAANTGTLQTRIKSISGNVVTLEDALPCVLTVASSAILSSNVNHPLLTDIRVRTLTFKCATSTPSHKLTLLLLSRVDNARVEDCFFNGSTGPLMTTRQTYGGHITTSKFKNGITIAGSGIENQTATGLLVAHNEVTMCQFGITFASAPYCRTIGNRINGRQTTVALGRGIRYGESSNFGVINGNAISDTNLFGIYMQDSAHCAIVGNTVAFTGDNVTNVGEHGIQLGGFEEAFTHHCTVSANVIRGCSGVGISAPPTTTNGVATYHAITGNTIAGCLQGGVLLFRVSHNVVSGNVISAPGATTVGGLIYVQSTGAGANVISGNSLASEDGVAVDGIDSVTGTLGANIITGNVLAAGLTLNLAATDRFGRTRGLVVTQEVATGANLTETVAALFTIPGGSLSATGDGFDASAIFTVAGNANFKNFKVYVGTAAVPSSPAAFQSVSVQVQVDVHAARQSDGTVKLWVEFRATRVDALGFQPGATFTTSVDDWTADQPVKFTMTNGLAVAADITFRMAKLNYT